MTILTGLLLGPVTVASSLLLVAVSFDGLNAVRGAKPIVILSILLGLPLGIVLGFLARVRRREKARTVTIGRNILAAGPLLALTFAWFTALLGVQEAAYPAAYVGNALGSIGAVMWRTTG
jgi:hypothetical protein